MKKFFASALLIVCAVGTAQAGSVSGSVAFVDMGVTGVNTGDINTATSFKFGDLISTPNTSGLFAGSPTPLADQHFGAASFSAGWAINNSLSISSAAFGSFQSISIAETVNTPGIVMFSILGNYTGGTFDSSVKNIQSTLTLTFIQDPAHTGVITASGIFGVSPDASGGPRPLPAVVPEPSTVVMGLTSVMGGALFYLLRRRRYAKAVV